MMVVVTVASLAFASIFLAYAKRKSNSQSNDLEPRSERSRASGGCMFGLVVATLVFGACAVAVALLVAAIFAYNSTSNGLVSSEPVQVTNASTARKETIEPGFLRLRDEILTMNMSGERAFKLQHSLHLAAVNDILTAARDTAIEVEQRHSNREINELGHVVVTINKLPMKTIADLEESLWKQLDEVVDVDQQRILRNNLKVHAGGGNGQEQFALTPTVLGMGRDGATIELWRVGAWFHWNARMGPASDNFKGQGPDLPSELNRFLSGD